MLFTWLGTPFSNCFVICFVNMRNYFSVEGVLNFKLTLLGETQLLAMLNSY